MSHFIFEAAVKVFRICNLGPFSLQTNRVYFHILGDRGGLAVELGPGRFGSEGARNYSSEKFAGHSLGKFFVNTPPGLASNDTGLTSNNLNGSLYDELHSAIYLLK